METHVFDIKGPYALFRKPYAPVSPVSFPFPPPPTVLGIIGAICGYGKEEYLERTGWDRTRIAVGIRSPVRRLRTGINLLNTKKGKFYRTDGGRIQIPHEFLKDAHYRIYVGGGPSGMMTDLGDHLAAGTTTYTVSLGLAQCLASVEFQGTFDAQPLDGGIHDVDTVVPQGVIDRVIYEEDHRYAHDRVPQKMAPGRKVNKYGTVVSEEASEDRPNKIQVDGGPIHSVGDDRVIFF